MSLFLDNCRLIGPDGVQLFFFGGAISKMKPPRSGRWKKWKTRRLCGISKRSGKIPLLDFPRSGFPHRPFTHRFRYRAIKTFFDIPCLN